MAGDRWNPVEVKVWGEWACFTRPDMKVERVSYPIITPSAARGVLEAIYWKPECRWRIEEIHLLSEVRWISILRNEVNSRASERTARDWARHGGGYIASEDRAQRHTLALRDVAYVIRARPVPTTGGADEEVKHRDQFRRRVARGQCFSMPYLGCREFAASFGPVGEGDRPIDRNGSLGRMLLDMDYRDDGSGRATPRFFEPRLDHGVMRVASVAPREG